MSDLDDSVTVCGMLRASIDMRSESSQKAVMSSEVVGSYTSSSSSSIALRAAKSSITDHVIVDQVSCPNQTGIYLILKVEAVGEEDCCRR